MIEWLRILFDKIWYRHGELLCFHHARGRFHVEYLSDKYLKGEDYEHHSAPFDWPTARDYADIFGGRVVHKRTGKVLYHSR